MWFYNCFPLEHFIFLVLIVCVDNMKQKNNNKNQLNVEIKIFEEAKEANETLKELLKNYKLQDKRDETIESDSSSEIDQLLRQISYIKKNKENRMRKQILSTNGPSNYYRGTAYIYEYQEGSELGGKDAKDDREEVINIKEEKTAEEAPLENDVKSITSSEITSGSDETQPKRESDEIVEIKFESSKKSPETSLNKNKPQRNPNDLAPKTRFSVLQSGKDINIRSNKSKAPYKIGNQRIVYSEQFSPETIWHDIINRPIRLNRVISSEVTSNLINQGIEKNTAIVFIDNREKEEKTKRLEVLETQRELANIETDEDSILRNGYGDECIQVPIKKCKKALKAVNKNVCKIRFKCKSDFKSDFNANSKKECVKKFSYKYLLSKESNYNISSETKDGNQFLDWSQQRHDSSKKSVIPLRNLSGISSKLSLRDKYEKRCQKESRGKCIAACNDATEKTCSRHACDKKKKKALKKACKEECKNIFVIDNNSSDSSNDSSDSDSDSGSD